MNKSAKKKNLVSIILTVLVIGLYLIPNFASAVSVRISTDKSNYENSEVVKFDVSVDIEDGEKVPVQNLTLKVNNTLKTCTFKPDGTLLSGCDNINITSKNVFSAGFGYGENNYGYGYGYGNTFETVNTSFGYGYGYGSGYGYGYGLTFPSELSYTIEWDIGKEGLANGVYEANLEALAKSDNSKFTYTSKNPAVFEVTGDNLVGDVNDVETNIPSLVLEIGGSTNLSNVTGTQNVVFKEGSENLVEFTWDFSSQTLDLSKVKIESSFTNGSNKIIVSGINLTGGATKTVYLNQTNISLNSVCVYDNEISSIETMSGDCSFTNETKVECNGAAQDGFTCTDLGTRLKVEGLKHSGLNQISFTAPVSTPAPSGGVTLGPGGGGGGGSWGWECLAWSECTSAGTQTRACNLVPGGSLSSKPAETQACTYTAPAPAVEEEPEPTAPTTPASAPAVTTTTPTAPTGATVAPPTGLAKLTGAFISDLKKPGTWIGIIVVALVLAGLYAGYYYLYKKKQ